MSTRRCSVDGCQNKHFGRGLCEKHYRREYRHGDASVVKEPCSRCASFTRVMNRNYDSELERQADLILLAAAGKDYRVTTRDNQGREYDLEDELVREA
jgi:hypothetical protein